MGIKTLNYILATLGFVGHLFLVVVLARRRLALRLPTFTILILFYLLRSLIFVFPNLRGTSVWPYWVMLALDPVLQCILYGAVVHAWWPLVLESKSAPSLSALGLVMIALSSSALAAWYIGPSSRFSPENLSIKSGVFLSGLWIEAGLALAAASAGLLMQLPEFTRNVVQGFAIYSAANVITEIGHMHFAPLRARLPYLEFSYLRVAAYLLCLALWIRAAYKESRIPSAHPAAVSTALE